VDDLNGSTIEILQATGDAIKRVSFGQTKDVTGPSCDFRSLLIPFSVVPKRFVGTAEQIQTTKDHRLIVNIPGSGLPAWGLSDHDLVKVLVEIGRQKVIECIEAGDLPSRLRVPVSIQTHGRMCPYTPGQLGKPETAEFEVQERRRIGFR
jgi:hypothetical protein